MSKISDFSGILQKHYTFSGKKIFLGKGIYQGKVVSGIPISIPLATMNRHGLIAGATGTGKTKTLQHIVEGLSHAGIPTVIMDIKGDVSGIAMPGTINDRIQSRLTDLDISDWKGEGFPVEFYTLSGNNGVKLKSTLTEYGPILFSRLLELNDTQESVISMIFKYCDDSGLLLLDLSDIKKVLQYVTNDGKEEIEAEYGAVSSSTISVIMRKIIELEGQGADMFFGEPSFDTKDFLRLDNKGSGYVNIIRLMDMMTRPKLFSTFMLSLLSEIYQTFPEEGDMEKPKLILIIDEAHLLFENANKTLLDEMEMVIKLIRSKGVGIFFCTQNPIDIPASILAQLGLKIQHALRAFTANDRNAIKKASQNFPETDFYTVADDITTLGIGEAFVTVLDEKGIPTPLVQTMMAPPTSRMDTLSDEEVSSLLSVSMLERKYNIEIDRESANEIIVSRIEQKLQKQTKIENTPTALESIGGGIVKNVGKTLATEIGRSLGKSIGGRTGGVIGAQIARGLLGAIFSGK